MVSAPVVGTRAHRPALLALVLGVILVLVGVTASALVTVASTHVSTTTLSSVVSRDASLVELFVNGNLTSTDLEPEGPSAARTRDLSNMLKALAVGDAILRIEIRGLDGRVLISDADAALGRTAPASAGMTAALDGQPTAGLFDAGTAVEAIGALPDATSYLQEYLPIMSNDGQPLAVVGLWRDAGKLVSSLDAMRNDLMLVMLAAGALLALVLWFVFRAAQTRLTRQHRQILDATRRDALTGLLNHGTVVGILAQEVEAARGAGDRIAVALVDVDNLRLFNDTHGHGAADELLLRVAELVAVAAGPSGHAARYGPDEFVIVRPGAGSEAMATEVARLRTGLDGVSVQFGDSEPLPISVSVGIAAYPEHAASVTELLSAAAVAVNEAKASGGNQVRVARLEEDESVLSTGFDILEGLVIAVDTKDRYTKRHSEDVARYAVFLARRMGLDEELQRTIHLAGLLHDIGKIGIPDVLLRKPSKLTAQEFAIFQQHVSVGDAIVRDVPNLDLVRAGIRYHHERWDGNGYLAGLDGEEIPLIGRLLAVADAFSAMTTTRPYRKALSVEEALKRLGDAAGKQLQEEFVTAFITGIETAPDAPLPGEDVASLWRPELWVA